MPEAETAEDDARDWPPWFRRTVLPYLSSSPLWPVLAAILGHVVVVVAIAMLEAVRQRSAGAIATLVGLVALSAAAIRFEVRHRSRPGALSLVVLLTWLVTVAVAWAAHRYGVY